ncbi:sugar kinase [Pantoea phytobeneficialis]|uniref:2-dehydro-3-deoxygluconokinase n=1 Tax=Pantoea phytobeneficialis TaxID=2052056 RepID=A0AAP9H8R5_9GAMM|nr:sugar kinase [Pantoea phytobeneficialis]MDO6409027.1 sugar kinase [Pantoea phytobeneficialis]QGR08855.1 2-dehydro-3-deoxygluconokinase [Pantoea phytobeneficialis]
MKDLDILSFGEPLYEFSQLPQAQQPVSYLSGYGGDTSNFAVSAARQGARVAMFTQLGNDVFGDQFVALWQQENVRCDWVLRHEEAPTGIYFISHDASGHHFTFYRKGSAASRLRPKDLPEAAIAAAKLLHTSAITLAISDNACDSVFAALELACNHQTLTSFDTNLRLKLWPLARARAVIHEVARLVDICMPSLDEARLLTGLQDADAIADFYLHLGVKHVVLKMGSEGAMYASAEERVVATGHQVATVDATGAGDCFSGAFLTRLLAGDAARNALHYANAAAALTTTGYGAVAPIPTRAQVEAFLHQAR